MNYYFIKAGFMIELNLNQNTNISMNKILKNYNEDILPKTERKRSKMRKK